MFGRIAGFIRELVLARVFGVSAQADVAIILLTLPDMLVNLLLSGGLSAALVPSFRLLQSPAAALQFRRISALVATSFLAIAAALASFPAVWIKLVAPGVPAAEAADALPLVRAAAIAIPLTALAGVSSAYLNANDRFFVPGCGTLLFNVLVIAGLAFGFYSSEPLYWLTAAIIIGALLRWCSQLVILPAGVFVRNLAEAMPQQRLWRNFVAASMAASLNLLAPIVIRALASLEGPGRIAAFTYASKLAELPSVIFLGSIATVTLTRLSACTANNDFPGARELYRDTLRRAVAIALALSILLALLAGLTVRLVFGPTNLQSDELSQIVTLFRLLICGLPFIAVTSVCTATLNALGLNSTLLRKTIYTILCLPVLCIPGIYLRSAPMLVTAYIAHQALLASILWAALRTRFARGTEFEPLQ